MSLLDRFHVTFFTKPVYVLSSGRMISHFELYFDLVLVGCFLHLGSLMNLDFGGILKDSDVSTGTAVATTESLPAIFATAPNFCAAVIFFVALWNSWYMFANYMVRFLAYDVVTSMHFFFFSIVILAMATVTDYGFDEAARDRFSNLFVWARGHLLFMNAMVCFYVPHGRRFSIASMLICLYSSLIIGIATIPKTSPTIAISLFIVAIFGETVLILCSEFALAPPVHLHLMSERHGGLILVSVGESIIQLALRKAELKADIVAAFLLSYAMSFIFVLLYFQCAPSHHGSHALRRGGFAAVIYTFFHCILEFFLLGFGVSVKIALKVASLEAKLIPEIVFIYIGTMVFGCLVAQDVIRLSHDAFKADSASLNSRAGSTSAAAKRFIWLLRVAVNCLVFAVVYGKQSGVGMLPYIASLFSLCLIKYGLDFFSRCFLPKFDDFESSNPCAANANHGVAGHDASRGATPTRPGDEGLEMFNSPIGRRMSTFALSNAGLVKPQTPKLGPKSPESTNFAPQISSAPADVKILALPTKGIWQPPAADGSQPSLALQTAHDVSVDVSRRHGSIVLSPVASPQQLSRQHVPPSLHSRYSPDAWRGSRTMGKRDISPALRDGRLSPAQELQRSASPGARLRAASPRSRGSPPASSSNMFSPAARLNGRGVWSPAAAGGQEDEVKLQRRNRLLALAAARGNQSFIGVMSRSMH